MEYGLVLRWLVAYAALWAAGLPLCARLFPRFAGRGAGFALPVALTVLTAVAYWVGHLVFGPVALAAGVLALAAAAVLAGTDRAALRERRLAPAPGLDVDRTAVAETAAVFVAAFLFLVAARAVDPAVYPVGGEKFLDFGLLKSLLRAEVLPPEDVWFAGETVNYYYGGHLIAALLARLTVTPPRFAYNLALAGFYAMLVTAAFDLAGAVAAERGVSRRRAGVAAAFFVGLASNLATPVSLAVDALPDARGRRTAEAIAARTDYTVDALLAGRDGFSYWSASRVVPGTINEFPLFAWLNGDLHAHMMGTPFVLLAAALGFAYYLTPETERRRRRATVFVAIPVLGGLQAVVDTWSFPTVFGLAWLALTFAPAHPLALLPRGLDARLRARVPDAPVTHEIVKTGAAAVTVGIAAGIALLFALPFFLDSAAAGDRAIDLLSPGERSPLTALVLVHGAFLATFAAFLATHLDGERPSLALFGIAAVGVVAFAQDLAVLLVVGPLLAFGWVGLRTTRRAGYETVLVVGGAGLVAIVELVYVREQAGPLRLNTVFKTYMQVWVLWGTAAGVALVALVRRALVHDGATPRAGERRSTSAERGGRRALLAGAVGLLVLSTSAYGGLALTDHFSEAPEPTLDATAFVAERHPGEAPAIDWIDAREGQPTLLSAPATQRYFGPGGGPGERMSYSWYGNPASSLTGVPTVAGWDHEVGYRGDEAYFERVRDVDVAFTGSPDEQAAVLRAYGVEYVWVGPAERERYGDAITLHELPGVAPAFETETVTVYRVDSDRLPGG